MHSHLFEQFLAHSFAQLTAQPFPALQLNQCIREPHIHLAVFVMQPTGEARLDFIQVHLSSGKFLHFNSWLPSGLNYEDLWLT